MTKTATPLPEVQALQAQMFAARLRVGPVLKCAGLHPSVWTRWKQGAEPKLSNLQAVQKAIDALTGEAEQ